MADRSVQQTPPALRQFDDRFLDGEAHAARLSGTRFPVSGQPRAHESRDTGLQIPMAAGTFMRQSHIALGSRFRALLLAVGNSNGI